MKAISRAARAEANRNTSRDSCRQQEDDTDDSNRDDKSPNLSQRSDDTDEIQAVNQSGLAYGAATARGHRDEMNQPETHIVEIRDLNDGIQQTTWPGAGIQMEDGTGSDV